MTSLSYSGLEVAPSADPEVAASTDQDTHKYLQYPGDQKDTHKIAAHSTAPVHDKSVKGSVCGLHKRTFLIAAIAAMIVIAVSVGGGVGGALATRKSGKPGDNNGSSFAQVPVTSTQRFPTESTSTSSTQIISTTTIVGPSNRPLPTLLRDCPSSNNTVHSVLYGSTDYQFRKLCNGGYQNSANLDSPVQGSVVSLDDCINLCAGYNQNNRTFIRAGRDPVCNAVCWRNSWADARFGGGYCFGFTMRNNTVNGQTVFDYAENGENCDSAALMNQDFQ
ncbi:hypothetical protein DE146DRAFT_782299 [Phaeosphaeria sp. MPI-PUGE-AT-0046c]|nr:hypothetical protein DE146DRAFT_782299 [Phaeosphaeria sp. MPI-PUGE-AT-0046c]